MQQCGPERAGRLCYTIALGVHHSSLHPRRLNPRPTHITSKGRVLIQDSKAHLIYLLNSKRGYRNDKSTKTPTPRTIVTINTNLCAPHMTISGEAHSHHHVHEYLSSLMNIAHGLQCPMYLCESRHPFLQMPNHIDPAGDSCNRYDNHCTEDR